MDREGACRMGSAPGQAGPRIEAALASAAVWDEAGTFWEAARSRLEGARMTMAALEIVVRGRAVQTKFPRTRRSGSGSISRRCRRPSGSATGHTWESAQRRSNGFPTRLLRTTGHHGTCASGLAALGPTGRQDGQLAGRSRATEPAAARDGLPARNREQERSRSVHSAGACRQARGA